MEGKETERITPKKAMALLREEGIYVDIEQAEMILGFLYEIAEIAVDAYLSQQKNRKDSLLEDAIEESSF